MKICFFVWMVREKPPYFGFQKTWVLKKQISMDYLNYEKMKEIASKLAYEYDTDRIKVIVYDGFHHFTHRYWFE